MLVIYLFNILFLFLFLKFIFILNTQQCGIPPLIVHCISEIERRGMDVIGLYRVSGSDKEVKSLKDKFNKEIPNLNNIDIHVLCSCLKDFIRTEKNNLISQNNLSKLTDALKKNTDIFKSFSQCIIELPYINRNILAFLILHLQKYIIIVVINVY